MKMKVLVTGCAGFIGWKVSELLLAEGNAVVGVDNLNTAYDPKLKEWRLEQLRTHPDFTFYRADISDCEYLEDLFRREKFDAVVNLAARAGVRQSLEDPWAYYETNVIGTLNLLELCRRHRVDKFILASTSSVYGSPPSSHLTTHPFKEDQPTDRPLSPYAASKKAAETLCYTYHQLYGLNIIVLRYFTVYGPAGRPDMSIFRFIRWIAEGEPVIIYGDGTQKRDFTYVDDIARGTLSALHLFLSSCHTSHSSSIYEIINLGSDHPVPLNHVISIIEELLGKKAQVVYKPKHPADVPATWADISKARSLLGWKPQTLLREGLQKAIEWYLQNQNWARNVRP
ncbi:MAG: GDP-mannose 4,6-dehydratase [Candidatus Hadarchaeum sp.]|uniref:GDP-mannose 4,6-dehydratase n=1 Tax=Candidatus Hadarchaeum sp. TaxID=2883567 RepID=UPI003D116662